MFFFLTSYSFCIFQKGGQTISAKSLIHDSSFAGLSISSQSFSTITPLNEFKIPNTVFKIKHCFHYKQEKGVHSERFHVEFKVARVTVRNTQLQWNVIRLCPLTKGAEDSSPI